jgi:hypothetical protein
MGYVNQYGLSRKVCRFSLAFGHRSSLLFFQHIFDAIKHSLERLQLDYVDVLQCTPSRRCSLIRCWHFCRPSLRQWHTNCGDGEFDFMVSYKVMFWLRYVIRRCKLCTMWCGRVMSVISACLHAGLGNVSHIFWAWPVANICGWSNIIL